MRKVSEKDLYTIEFSEPAQIIFSSAFASTNPHDALKQLTHLLSGKVILRCEAVEYSRLTGKPVRYAWEPFKEWGGNLWFNSLGNSPSLSKDMPLYKPLLAFLPVGKTIVIKSGGDNFVVRHVPSRGNVDGTVPNHLEFTKAELHHNQFPGQSTF